MSNPETLARVMKVLQPFAKNTKAFETATAASKLREDLQVNSARLIDIVLELENQFEIKISDDDADTVETVGDALRIVEAKLAAR